MSHIVLKAYDDQALVVTETFKSVLLALKKANNLLAEASADQRSVQVELRKVFDDGSTTDCGTWSHLIEDGEVVCDQCPDLVSEIEYQEMLEAKGE